MGGDGRGHLLDAARVGDLELGRLLGRRCRVAAHAGARGGRVAGRTERQDAVAELGALPGGDGQPGARQEEPQGGHELDKGFVIHREVRPELTALRLVEAGQGDRHLGVEEGVLQVAAVQAGVEQVPARLGQAEQGAQVDPAQTGPGGPLGRVEPPEIVPLAAGQVHAAVHLLVVGLLEQGHGVHPGLGQLAVLVHLERIQLDGHRGEVPLQAAGRLDQIGHGRDLRRLTGEKEHVTHAGGGHGPGLGLDFGKGQGAAQDGVLVVEAAVGAAVRAVVGDVERHEHLHRAAEVLQGQPVRPLRHLLQMAGGPRAEQGEEIHGREFFPAQAALHVRSRYPLKKSGEIKVPVLFDDRKETHGLPPVRWRQSSRKPVSGDEARAVTDCSASSAR